MSTLIQPGESIDGFTVGELLHAGGNGYIYHVQPPTDRDPGFPVLMKVPGVGRGEPALGVVSFEIEQMVQQQLDGPHVPRIVAVGEDPLRPYFVMERIIGQSLAAAVKRAPLSPMEVCGIGAALADAVYSVHRQRAIHFDLKPENFMLRPTGIAVLLDFGFARHARLPDLLAEAKSFAAGSAAYVSPEQLQSSRNDSRSDLFSLGVLLYELATGEQPFGEPVTYAGMRDRLWRLPRPPRSRIPAIPAPLQEVILHCLEVSAQQRYASAAHIAFDLRHLDEVQLTRRAEWITPVRFGRQLRNWWRAWGSSAPAIAGSQMSAPAPVILVAVDTEHMDDERHPALQQAARSLIMMNVDFRLMLVSAIRSARLGEGERIQDSASGRHLEHRYRLRTWATRLRLLATRTSLHVIESADPAATILELARSNHVDLIVIGAPGPSERALAWWRSVASGVTAGAPCSVHVVRVPQRDEVVPHASQPTPDGASPAI